MESWSEMLNSNYAPDRVIDYVEVPNVLVVPDAVEMFMDPWSEMRSTSAWSEMRSTSSSSHDPRRGARAHNPRKSRTEMLSVGSGSEMWTQAHVKRPQGLVVRGAERELIIRETHGLRCSAFTRAEMRTLEVLVAGHKLKT